VSASGWPTIAGAVQREFWAEVRSLMVVGQGSGARRSIDHRRVAMVPARWRGDSRTVPADMVAITAGRLSSKNGKRSAAVGGR
jgi:hypothetical protein